MSLAASSYPLLNLFWTILIIFLWVIWIWVLIWVFIDIFRSRDLSGWAKALWVLFVVVIPLIGVLVYLIARGGAMHERAAQPALFSMQHRGRPHRPLDRLCQQSSAKVILRHGPSRCQVARQ